MRLSPVNLKILAYSLEIEGFDSTAVLRQCGIASNDALEEDGEWLPVELLDRLMAAAIEHTGDASFGLVVGKSLALAKYGVITPVVLSSPTLRQMLDDVQRFALLSVERSEIELDETMHGARLVVQPVVTHGLSGRFRMEQVTTSAVQMLRFTGADTRDIFQVHFPYAAPSGLERRYAANFGPRIAFEHKACAISFNPALLDRPLLTHDPVSYATARTRADSFLAARQAGSGVADQVRQWVLSHLPALPTVAETAAQMGMTERSFRRQLALLGTTHADLIQECQRLMAERLLAEGRQPLKQIAESLGFSSAASFHRAFRRWSGHTPSGWRQSREMTDRP